jgi:ribosomal protein S18 acetylase RimI-like enzyme
MTDARPDGASGIVLRGATPEDRDALYEICVRTGDAGSDATSLIDAPSLYGHLYAGAYLALEPELATVAVSGDAVVGYVLAALDTDAFEARLETDWWPPLRTRYPLPATGTDLDQRFIGAIHSPPITPATVTHRYPSHLHIDLLPVAQGHGVGKRLMHHLFDQLRAAGSIGVHLGVDPRNAHAIGFHEHLGMRRHDHGAGVLFTQSLA